MVSGHLLTFVLCCLLSLNAKPCTNSKFNMRDASSGDKHVKVKISIKPCRDLVSNLLHCFETTGVYLMSINCDDVVKHDAVRSNIVINEADSALRSRNEFLTREAEGENCAMSCALVINRS